MNTKEQELKLDSPQGWPDRRASYEVVSGWGCVADKFGVSRKVRWFKDGEPCGYEESRVLSWHDDKAAANKARTIAERDLAY